MKITTKINLLTTAWMLCILIIINFVVYFLFMQTTVNMEEDMQYQKANDILKEIDRNQASSEIEEKIKDHLSEHSYIRVMGTKDKLIHQVTNDKVLTQK